MLNQDVVKNITVRRNVHLGGKTTTHQIDVYWEYELAGIVHRVVVQAKDWGRVVDQGELLKFKSVLDDIPGQPRGIFVTRSGYQRGAKHYAKNHGIELYELDRPSKVAKPDISLSAYGILHFRILGLSADGRFLLRYTKYEPSYSSLAWKIDRRWYDALTTEHRGGADNTITVLGIPVHLNKVYLTTTSGEMIETVSHALSRPMQSLIQAEKPSGPFVLDFSEPTFLNLPGSAAPIKVVGVSGHIDVTRTTVDREGNSSVVGFVLVDALRNKRQHFRDDHKQLPAKKGRVRE